MSLITEILLVISSSCRAASLLRWLLSFICPAARAEMLSVCRALSVFCSITACISCIEEEIFSAEEACWLALSPTSLPLGFGHFLARRGNFFGGGSLLVSPFGQLHGFGAQAFTGQGNGVGAGDNFTN